MRINKILVSALVMALSFYSCDYLDVPPINIIQDDAIFNSESGITSYMTTLYYDLPIEDFRYTQQGFNVSGKGQGRLPNVSGEAMCSSSDDISTIGDGTWWGCWDYGKIRRVNYFLKNFPAYKSNFQNTVLADAWMGEAHFIRAYCYFAMVKRYGGVPILREPQEYVGDIESLKVPRDTEKACYDFIAEDLDEAFRLLPDNEEILGKGRATKYAALALKSRAMLYAGSIARYGTVDLNGLVGIDKALANDYFELAYKAVKELEKSKRFSLYRKNSDKEKNFAELFLAEDSPENIFCKYFQRNVNAHGWDVYFVPYQYRGNGFSSNMNPTLEFVEMFEHKDGTPANFAERAKDTYFDDPSELFQNMDARFGGSIIYPNAIFKGEPCSIQKGLIIEDGSKKENATNYEEAVYTANDGQVYHIVGKSGSGNYSGNMTGFFMRKYLNENMPQSEVIENYSEQHWIEFRYAEALLNGAQAAVEMGQHLDDALLWINDIRSRANIKQLSLSDLTVDKVRHERRIELAFENHTYWDLRRWRIADKEIETKQYTGLCPYFDINKQKYIFEEVAANKYYYTFDVKMYYERIPDGEIAKNEKLKQNPYYN
ncbi:RagB/SusD family nutrient uptake outer membrane protein [Barnesiella intestinihominis]|uniref:RagB/SusD family nutrient uptake outer membrane protein n=1 Tax=Barnesiella intestinihominis TaxID=487174 RepID=UPI00388F3E16